MHKTNPHLVVSGSNDKTAKLWDTRVGVHSVAIVAMHDNAIRRFQFDDMKMISGGDDSLLRTWDIRKLETCNTSNVSRALCLFRMPDCESGRVSALQYDATRLITAFTLGTTVNGTHRRRGSIKIWNLDSMTADVRHR